ncbi:MAG: ATP-binding protein, partial [Chloroflexaceae bacterium]|nr:ATP-binding protein [Chloroflexaceae bacterium]
QTETYLHALQYGAQDYITAPLNPGEVLARVATQVQAYQARAALLAEQRRLALLYNIARDMAASLNLDELLQHIVAGTVVAVRATHGTLILLNDRSGPRITTASQQASTPASETTIRVIKQGLAGWVLRTGRTALIPDVEQDERWLPMANSPYQARSAVAVPLLSTRQNRLEVSGVLTLSHDQPGAFTEDDVSLLESVADHARLAIRQARLYNAVVAEQQTLQAILASAREGVLVTDAQGQGRLINPAASRVLQLAPEQFVGQALDQLAFPEPLRLQLVNPHESRDLELELFERSYRVLVAPVARAGGGAVAVLTDVTHFKALDELKNQFLSTASHDLKSPLSVISGYAQALPLAGPLNEQQQHYVQRIEENARRMVALISDLLDLTTMDSGLGLRRAPCQLNQLVQSVVENDVAKASQQRLTLRSALTQEQLTVLGDAGRLRQVVENLLTNAIKYTPAGGTIDVMLQRDDSHGLLVVRDSGIGLSAQDVERVFERFYRVQPEANMVEGTGLGLAIVKTIVEAHGGAVWAESVPGQGSSFKVRLPLIGG